MEQELIIPMEEQLISQLQELLEELGLDVNTYFRMVAKQTVREQAIPFSIGGKYGIEVYKKAMQQTKYSVDGKAVISVSDEWIEETEWDVVHEQLKPDGVIAVKNV